MEQELRTKKSKADPAKFLVEAKPLTAYAFQSVLYRKMSFKRVELVENFRQRGRNQFEKDFQDCLAHIRLGVGFLNHDNTNQFEVKARELVDSVMKECTKSFAERGIIIPEGLEPSELHGRNDDADAINNARLEGCSSGPKNSFHCY